MILFILKNILEVQNYIDYHSYSLDSLKNFDFYDLRGFGFKNYQVYEQHFRIGFKIFQLLKIRTEENFQGIHFQLSF